MWQCVSNRLDIERSSHSSSFLAFHGRKCFFAPHSIRRSVRISTLFSTLLQCISGFARLLCCHPSILIMNETETTRQRKTTACTCKVCGEPAQYSYYGAVVCRSCKVFFRRNTLNKSVRSQKLSKKRLLPFVSLLFRHLHDAITVETVKSISIIVGYVRIVDWQNASLSV